MSGEAPEKPEPADARGASQPLESGASVTTSREVDMMEPIPEGYHSVTPYLTLDEAAEAIEFYKKAFGATERVRMEAPGGQIGHAELEIGDSLVMLADAFPQSSTRPPNELGGTTGGVFLYVEDGDAVV